ncbi:MAG: replication protein RepA [Bacteroidota bacterium]
MAASEASKVQKRVVEAAVAIKLDPADERNAVFQHSVLCQTSLPYRNPGDEVRHWERKQGRASLLISAGSFYDPVRSDWVEMGLPYGPKSRLILAHINTQAVKTQSREIEVGASLTQFIKRLGLANKGSNFKIIKDQLARLTVSGISLAFVKDEYLRVTQSHIIESLNLWLPEARHQRSLWQSTIELGERYYESLAQHAVPLDERALAALAHNCMAMDLYCWLAQRLHRVHPQKPAFVDWQSLKEQFGPDYGRMAEFKRVFRKYLRLSLTQYPAAKLEEIHNKGFRLYHSPAPIRSTQILISRSPQEKSA